MLGDDHDGNSDVGGELDGDLDSYHDGELDGELDGVFSSFFGRHIFFLSSLKRQFFASNTCAATKKCAYIQHLCHHEKMRIHPTPVPPHKNTCAKITPRKTGLPVRLWYRYIADLDICSIATW